MSKRDPQSILSEGDYWKAVLDDVSTLNALVGDAAEAVSQAVIPSMSVAMSEAGVPMMTGREGGELSRALDGALDALTEAQETIMGLTRLTDGRYHALREEFDGGES